MYMLIYLYFSEISDCCIPYSSILVSLSSILPYQYCQSLINLILESFQIFKQLSFWLWSQSFPPPIYPLTNSFVHPSPSSLF